MPRPTRRAHESAGRRAEFLAGLWLALKFYRVLGWRVRNAMGEIDLVARSPAGIICFVEVKARPDETQAAEAVTLRQRERISRAALLYLGSRPRMRHNGVRFDVIYIAPGHLPRHVKDAWRPDR